MDKKPNATAVCVRRLVFAIST